jgi:radical SAM superfamily enzyme YgiQ (UPF0313 family)
MQTKKTTTKDLIASELSQVCIKYKHSTNRIERNKLFAIISEHYLPKMYKYMFKLDYHDKNDFMQIYHYQILLALDKWAMKSNAETYLWNYVLAVPRLYLSSKNMFKSEIKYTLVDDDSDLDIELTPTELWDKVKETKLIHKSKPNN